MSSIKQQLPLAVLTGWIITIGAWIWNTSEVKSNFEYRIQGLEDETKRLEDQMTSLNTSNSLIMTELAEIRTDLIWIRRTLEENK
tara:strand:+ start:797 stop:1051 length:255 start_codon:yes stop_codon:yes gene_type:complete